MKNTIVMLVLLVFGLVPLFGQDIHSPAEILEIMEKSPVSYELYPLEQAITPLDRSQNLNANIVYRVVDQGQLMTYTYKPDSLTKSYSEQAEAYFQARDFASARQMYLKALENDPSYYKVMTYVGQMYGIEGDFDQAIAWYQRTIELNYIDYMAHWFLADAYRETGDLDKAVDEITIAQTLNRNNPRIQKSLQEIYALKKLKTADWTFTPQVRIDSLGVNSVRVSFDADWLGYGMVKAVWQYEPNYKASMGVKDGTFSTLEERECFAGLMATFDKKILKAHPEFKALKSAVDQDLVEAFIFYEIVLPEHPYVAYQLPEDFIRTIKDYVRDVRAN